MFPTAPRDPLARHPTITSTIRHHIAVYGLGATHPIAREVSALLDFELAKRDLTARLDEHQRLATLDPDGWKRRYLDLAQREKKLKTLLEQRKERAGVNDYEPRYHCTLDPVGGDHEVGCPHQPWTVEQLQEALDALKRVNDYLSDALLEQKTGGRRYGQAGRQESVAGA